MQTKYSVVNFLRKANKEGGCIWFNPCNGSTIEMDENSRSILEYIYENSPSKTEILTYGEKIEICKEEILAFLECLKTERFIYEIREQK